MGRAQRQTAPPVKTVSSAVARAKATGKRQAVKIGDRGSPGLQARVGPKGDVSYFLRYRQPGGRQVAITFSAEDAPAAREHAKDILAKARRATVGAEPDPWEAAQAAKEEEQRRRAGGDTVSDMADRYLADAGKALAPATVVAYKNILKARVLPALGKMRPAEVERQHVRALVDVVRKEGKDTHANRVLASVKALFTWAQKNDLVGPHPCDGLSATEEKPNERVYSDEELRAILEAARGTAVEHLVPLILLTACRPGEARAARWKDFEQWKSEDGAVKCRLWMILATDTKGGTRPLPMSKAAVDALPPRGKSPFLFPAGTKTGFMDPPQTEIDLIRERTGLDVERVLHTLRATARTRMSRLGTPADIGERILGHVASKVRRAYDHFDYVPQMKLALDAWARELERIVKNEKRKGNIVPMVR